MEELAPEVEALRKIPFFEGLTPEDLDRIARVGERRTFAPGEEILARGSAEGQGMFVILSGTASVEAGERRLTRWLSIPSV